MLCTNSCLLSNPIRYLAARKARSGAGGGELRVERQGSEAEDFKGVFLAWGRALDLR